MNSQLDTLAALRELEHAQAACINHLAEYLAKREALADILQEISKTLEGMS